MHKIFINEHPLIISGCSEAIYTYKHLRIMDDDDKSLLQAVVMLENTDKSIAQFGVLIPTVDEADTVKRFRKNFIEITAAGGLVFNAANDLLLIKRQGKWDLPKGKKDAGEKVEQAAVREVQEECGIKNISLGQLVTKSYHTYFIDRKRVLKITHWYRMNIDANENFTPQTEENITEVKWFHIPDIHIDQLDTYNSIRDVLRAGILNN